MQSKIIKFSMAIVVSAIFMACFATDRIATQNLTFKNNDNRTLPNNLRMTLVRFSNENILAKHRGVKSSNVRTLMRMEYYAAAQAVFSRIGQISEDTTFSPHLIVNLKNTICSTTRFSGGPCQVSVELYWGMGEFIRTYEAKTNLLDYNYSSGVYNCYVDLFKSIVEQMLADELLSKYFNQGFDDSKASATPDIPQIPNFQAKLKREAEDAQLKAQAEKNRRDSATILAKARSRGYATLDEIDSVLSLGPIASDLNALILESRLPFPREMDQALEQGNLQNVQYVSFKWRKWIERSREHVWHEAEERVLEQLSHLDKLDRQFRDPFLGKLTIKLAQAIKQERWEDAKNIQSLIQAASPSEPMIIESSGNTQERSDSAQCDRAKRDYEEALAAYNSSRATRNTRNNESAAAGFASLSGRPESILMGWLGNSARTDAQTSQNDMDHALLLMQDARRRMTLFCTD